MRSSNNREDESVIVLLRLLADGQFHSGEELGEVLGVSRAAVWKHLQKLDLPGLTLQSVKGKGYRIDGGLDLLSREKILTALAPEVVALISHLDLQVVVDSTNTEALRQGKQWGCGYVCLAEQQLAGRGRRGRAWASPFGRNIYLSLSWAYDQGAAALEGLSLAVGVALVEALEAMGFADLSLKWPNDLLWQGRKLAGVLLEMGGDPAGQCQVVVGVGLNVAMPEEAAIDITQPWVDLYSIAPEHFAGPLSLDRNSLTVGLLSHLLPLMHTYASQRFSSYRASWEKRNAFAGQSVTLSMPNQFVSGRMLGVDDKGALRLATESGEQLYYGGEISLRPEP